MEERRSERTVIGVMAFIMIVCGLGIAVCLGVGLGAFIGSNLVSFYTFQWGHGLSIMIPGFIGLFVWCACGCCNSRTAYIVSAVFDSLGLLSLLGPLIILWAVEYLFLAAGSANCSTVGGQCICQGSGLGSSSSSSISFGRSSISFSDDCSRYQVMYACGQALACMWAFGAIATIIHLVLVCHLACVMRESAPSHIMYTQAQAPIQMQQTAGYPAQPYPAQQAYPAQQPYPSKGGY